MSNVDNPPNPYFNGINFNPSFFLSMASNYLTEAIANSKYLRLIGGILTGNLGIKTTPIAELDINGKAYINNGFGTFPGNGVLGTNGTRLILHPGTPTEPPFALGYNANELWYGTRTGGSHAFFTGTTERMRINGSGNVGIGTDDPGTYRCRIRGSANNTFLRIETPNNLASEVSGIEFGVPAFTSSGTAKITSTSGVADINNLQFHTSSGTNLSSVKMTILGNGRIGIGITDPGSRFEVNGPISSLGTDAVMYVGGVGTGAALCQAAVAGSFSTSSEIGDAVIRSQTTKKLLLQSGSGAANLVITSAGDIGIGGTDPISRLSLRSDYNDLFTGFSIDARDGISTYNLRLYPLLEGPGAVGYNFRVRTQTNAFDSLTLRHNGNVGIGSTIPGNIFQVGDGARLRISNGPTDYTLIGTKQIDDSANTCIYLNGNTLSGNAGNIAYYATTSTGRHSFFTNGDPSNTLATLSPDKCRFFKPLRSMNCQYENEGQQYPFTSGMVNVSGTTLNGYFIPVNDYTNSLMTCAFSHDSTVYTYWRGHVTIGKNNDILAVSSAISSSNLLVENFVQQTTFISYIRVVPTVSYNVATLLRVKIYG